MATTRAQACIDRNKSGKEASSSKLLIIKWETPSLLSMKNNLFHGSEVMTSEKYYSLTK